MVLGQFESFAILSGKHNLCSQIRFSITSGAFLADTLAAVKSKLNLTLFTKRPSKQKICKCCFTSTKCLKI